MIEVFRTNVKTPDHARMLINHIHSVLNYDANFDLQDCDRILRVRSASGPVKAYRLIRIFRELGFHAEVLDDNPPSLSSKIIKHYL
jgi:hypothetical protein